MKKKYRVKKNKDYQKVYHKGKSVANRQLVLYLYPQPNQTHFRVGLSVGKKMGNAVQRNKIKRYLRQAVQELENSIKPDIDFLLIARPNITGRSYHEVKQSVIHVMKLAGILNLANLKPELGGKNEKN